MTAFDNFRRFTRQAGRAPPRPSVFLGNSLIADENLLAPRDHQFSSRAGSPTSVLAGRPSVIRVRVKTCGVPTFLFFVSFINQVGAGPDQTSCMIDRVGGASYRGGAVRTLVFFFEISGF